MSPSTRSLFSVVSVLLILDDCGVTWNFVVPRDCVQRNLPSEGWEISLNHRVGEEGNKLNNTCNNSSSDVAGVMLGR